MQSNPPVSILTDPIPWRYESISVYTCRIGRYLRDRILPSKQNFNRSVYRGHFAVTRSLVEGLKKIKASFNYNPQSVDQLGEVVIVLAGVRTLRQAIRMKQQGYIKSLFAGPNIVIFSSDYNSILAAPEIDYVITPSDFVVDLYAKDTPSVKGRCFAWPAGVDTEYWKPDENVRANRVLVFQKQDKEPVGPYIEHLSQRGYAVDLIQYGCFVHSEYRDMLRKACLMVGFSVSESQGIAWAEAWSTDVPTFLWESTSNVYRGRPYKCSSAPYLCPENGLFFRGLEDFKTRLASWEQHRGQFSPRAWTLQNMSDEICASALYRRATGC